ncbi:hypothetical protein [Ornithinibacillus xuwenensis]|uniref:Tail fiber protein n=1 Tax=Ornithinibacillus xuwenensis TaxID=3144668 RepID=A0ABU9XFY5_9BACI
MAYEKQLVNAGDIMDPAWGNHVQTQYDESLPKVTSDSQGECWRFDSGLQIYYGTAIVSSNGSDVVTHPVTFPLPFSDKPSITTNLETGVPNLRMTAAGTVANASFNLYVRNDVAGATDLKVNYTAIGRWK